MLVFLFLNIISFTVSSWEIAFDAPGPGPGPDPDLDPSPGPGLGLGVASCTVYVTFWPLFWGGKCKS